MATTFMNLSLPTPTVTLGPAWATQLNTALESVDAHDHTSGKGKRITVGAMNIDQNLNFNSFAATNLNSTQYATLLSTIVTPSSVYTVGGNLYFTNGSGVPVQVTAGGSVVTTPASLQAMQYDFVNTDLVINPADVTVLIAVDTSSIRTITLPLASAVVAGRIYAIEDATGSSESFTLTVATSGIDTINGLPTYSINSNYACLYVVGDGVSKWRVI